MSKKAADKAGHRLTTAALLFAVLSGAALALYGLGAVIRAVAVLVEVVR